MRPWVSAAFFVSYLAFQLGLPLYQWQRHHGTFRWAMFAPIDARREVFAEYADGSRESLVQIQLRTGRAHLSRGEINRERILPPYLCALTPQPARIVFRNVKTGEEKRFPCR
jgi:hypothetical protein